MFFYFRSLFIQVPKLRFKVGVRGFAAVKQGQVRGSALSVPDPACHWRPCVAVAQWPCRTSRELRNWLQRPHPTTVMISSQIL